MGFIELAIPVGALVWFIVSLVQYLGRDKNNPEECSRRKTMLIVSSILCGFIIVAIIALILLVMAFLASM